jgi:hypothetical protein
MDMTVYGKAAPIRGISGCTPLNALPERVTQFLFRYSRPRSAINGNSFTRYMRYKTVVIDRA